jgi:hypothetical protein
MESGDFSNSFYPVHSRCDRWAHGMILGWRRARFTAGQASRRLGPHLALYLPVEFFLRRPSLISCLPTTRQQCCLGNHARR